MSSTPNSWLKRKQISVKDVLGDTKVGGRTPWYSHNDSSTSSFSLSSNSKRKQTFLIGVAGGTASGKTSVCRAIVNDLQLPWVQILSMDCFYRPLTKKQRDDVDNYNFDHPDAFDWDLLYDVLCQLKSGKAVKCPQYDFTTHSRKKEYTLMYGADVVLCEGILILYDKRISDQFDIKVFVNTDDDIRLIRRIKRDMKERGRSLESVLDQYQKTVKPSYNLFCEPTQSRADIVIPRGKTNVIAIRLLSDHIKNKLIKSGNVDAMFYDKNKLNQFDKHVTPKNVILPTSSSQLKLKTNELSLNDKLNGKELLQTISFLCTQLLQTCISTFIPKRYKTPSPPLEEEFSPSPAEQRRQLKLNAMQSIVDEQNDEEEAEMTPEIIYLSDEDESDDKNQDDNKSFKSFDSKQNELNGHKDVDDVSKICIVTVFSGGMLFGETIMEIFGNKESLYKVKYGSIHIFHESHKPTKPRFYDRKLPLNINKQKVIMVDAFIGTGNRARMALQVLMDHNVPQENICLITLMSSHSGITKLAKVFPDVQFITAKIDPSMETNHWERIPLTSELVLKYCKSAGIDIIEDDLNE